MITREQWDAMSEQSRWDLFNAMQYEIAAADNAVDAGDDDEDVESASAYTFDEVLALRANGMKLADIASKFGRSKGWAGWAVSRAKHLQRWDKTAQPDNVMRLTVDRRIINTLKRGGINTIDQAWEIVNQDAVSIRGLGQSSLYKLKCAILAYKVLS